MSGISYDTNGYSVSIDESGEITSSLTRERDIPLTLRTSASPEILEKLGIRPPTEGIMHAMLGILGALCEADERWVSYSRRREWYVGQQILHGLYFTCTNIVEAVDSFDRHGCIEHRRAKPGTTSKWQSSMRATPALLELLQAPSTVYQTDSAPLIIMRGADKRAIEVPNNRDVAAMRPKLAVLREAEDAIRLELNAPGVEHTAHHVIVDGNKIANLSDPSLTRVFSRGSTRFNGRRHVSGGGYQSLPSEYRRQLLINGQPVSAADFRALHPQMMYAQADAQLDGDPYTGIDGLSRDEAKTALLVAINAPVPTTRSVNATRAFHANSDVTPASG